MSTRVLCHTKRKSHSLIYLKNLLTDRYVASVAPSSGHAVEKVCSRINFKRNLTIVEYGPGMGVFTFKIIEKMTSRSRLIAIERNPNFHLHLSDEIDDPRTILINDSAENILGILDGLRQGKVDYILSGIPFSFLPETARKSLVENSYAALKKGGKFLAYQTFYQQKGHLKTHLEYFFDVFPMEYVFLCFPPLAIYEATKK